jgi:hypothetical protein
MKSRIETSCTKVLSYLTGLEVGAIISVLLGRWILLSRRCFVIGWFFLFGLFIIASIIVSFTFNVSKYTFDGKARTIRAEDRWLVFFRGKTTTYSLDDVQQIVVRNLPEGTTVTVVLKSGKRLYPVPSGTLRRGKEFRKSLEELMKSGRLE